MYCAPCYATRGQLIGAPSGAAGVWQTVRLMREMIKGYRVNTQIIDSAISLIFLVPSKDDIAEVNAIFEYVRDSIRYTRDVYGIETLADPVTTLIRRVGDCDDKTTLFCALCEAVGYPTRLVMAGYFGSKDFQHIYAQVWVNNQWIDADTTESDPLGYAPPSPSVYWIEKV